MWKTGTACRSGQAVSRVTVRDQYLPALNPDISTTPDAAFNIENFTRTLRRLTDKGS
jgi:hypothetical protein